MWKQEMHLMTLSLLLGKLLNWENKKLPDILWADIFKLQLRWPSDNFIDLLPCLGFLFWKSRIFYLEAGPCIYCSFNLECMVIKYWSAFAEAGWCIESAEESTNQSKNWSPGQISCMMFGYLKCANEDNLKQCKTERVCLK